MKIKILIMRHLLVVALFIFSGISFQGCGRGFQAVNQKVGESLSSTADPQPPSQSQSQTGEVELAWDPVTPAEDGPSVKLKGYRIYYGLTSQNYANTISENEVGDVTSFRIKKLVRGKTYYFAIRAVSEDGLEGELSAEISYLVK